MIQLRTLGELDLRRADGARVQSVLSNPKRAALLAWLTVARPGGLHRRDTLLGLFWPELDEDRARAALRKGVHLLRQSLGGDVIIRQGDDQLGVDPARIWCDAVELEKAAAAADLETALDLHRGPFLEGFHLTGAPEFEHWVDSMRARTRDAAFGAACGLAERAERAGEPFAAAAWARRAMELQPWDEQALRLLLNLLDRLGDRAGATEAYRLFERRLAAEFQESPDPETCRLIAQIRARSPAAGEPVEGGEGGEAPEAVEAVEAPGALEAPGAVEAVEAVIPPGAWGGTSPAAGRASLSLRLRRGLAAAMLVIVAAAGWLAFTSAAAEVQPGDTVAVFPFIVRGGPELEHLGEGMVTLLSANLNTVGELRSVDASVVLGTVGAAGSPQNAAEARALAERLGARFYLTGGVLEVGGELRISATLYDRRPGGRHVDVVVQGESGTLFQLVDELTTRLIAGRVTEPSLQLGRAGALSTTSVHALHAFLRGEREYRAGRYHAAVDLFAAATRADSTFGLAWYRLASARRWAKVNGADAALYRAVRHADRLPDRERMIVQAYNHVQAGRPEDAERLYRQVLATHPDDVEAWSELGEVLFHWKPMRGGSILNARDAWERAAALAPDHAGALEHLARIAAAAGEQQQARTLAQRVVALDPAHAGLPALVMARGVSDSVVIERLRRADAHTLVQTVAQLAALTDDLAGARRVAAELIATDRYNHLSHGTLSVPIAQGSGHILLAGVELAGGRVAHARRALKQAHPLQPAAALEIEVMIAVFAPWAFTPAALDSLHAAVAATPQGPSGTPLALGHPERRALMESRRALMLGLLDVRRAAARALREDVPLDAHPFARAYAALIAGEPAAALQHLGDPIVSRTLPTAASFPSLLQRLLRAEAHRALGGTEAALQWYATFPDGTGYDFPFLPLTYLRRAELLDAAGQHREAAYHYARFAALWQDCDPELRPLVEHARSRISELSRYEIPVRAADTTRR
jgi:DNA-binding SARP family transcriptional activator/TolB-like protein